MTQNQQHRHRFNGPQVVIDPKYPTLLVRTCSICGAQVAAYAARRTA